MNVFKSLLQMVLVPALILTSVPIYPISASAQSSAGLYTPREDLFQMVLGAARLQKSKKYNEAYVLLSEAIRILKAEKIAKINPIFPPVLDPKTNKMITVSEVSELPEAVRSDKTMLSNLVAVREQYNEAGAISAKATVINNLQAAQYSLKNTAGKALTLGKLPALNQVIATPEYTDASSSDPNINVALLSQTNPEYKNTLYNLSRSLTFRDTRTVRAQRAIDPTGYGGMSSALYPNSGSFGTANGYDSGGLAQYVIGSGIFSVDYDRQALEFFRRYDNVKVDELVDKLIRRVLFWQIPLGFVTDTLGKLGPRNDKIIIARGGTPEGQGQGGGYGQAGGYDQLSGYQNSGVLQNYTPNINDLSTAVSGNGIQGILNSGRNIITSPNAKYLGDSLVAFALYSALMLQMAALYDVQINSNDLAVLMPMMLVIAQWRVLYYTKFPELFASGFKKVVGGVLKMAKILGRKAKTKAESIQQQKDLATVVKDHNSVGFLQLLENTAKTSNKFLKLTPQQAETLFYKNVMPAKNMPSILTEKNPFTLEPVSKILFDKSLQTNLKNGAGQPGGGGTGPIPYPNDPNNPGKGGQNPDQGAPGTHLTFKQIFTSLGVATLYGSLRYMEALTITNTMKALFKQSYEEDRKLGNVNFQRALTGSEGMPYLKILAMAVQTSVATRVIDGKARPQGPQPIVYDNFRIVKTDKPHDVFLKNQLIFIRNVARSAKRCEVLTSADRIKMEKAITAYINQEKTQDAQLKPLAKCVTLEKDPNVNKRTDTQSTGVLPTLGRSFIRIFYKGSNSAKTYVRSDKCSDAEFKKFSELVEKVQTTRAAAADVKITLDQCSGAQSNEEFNLLRAEFQTFNGIRLGEDEIAAIQNQSFDSRLRMGELVIQIQMLKGLFRSDGDKDFFNSIVLPAIGLNNDIAKNYYSRYEGFVRSNGGLIPYPWAPTGFSIQQKLDSAVYDWNQGYSPPFAPSTKTVDYLINERAPYVPPGYGQGGFYGGGGGYGTGSNTGYPIGY